MVVPPISTPMAEIHHRDRRDQLNQRAAIHHHDTATGAPCMHPHSVRRRHLNPPPRSATATISSLPPCRRHARHLLHPSRTLSIRQTADAPPSRLTELAVPTIPLSPLKPPAEISTSAMAVDPLRRSSSPITPDCSRRVHSLLRATPSGDGHSPCLSCHHDTHRRPPRLTTTSVRPKAPDHQRPSPATTHPRRQATPPSLRRSNAPCQRDPFANTGAERNPLPHHLQTRTPAPPHSAAISQSSPFAKPFRPGAASVSLHPDRRTRDHHLHGRTPGTHIHPRLHRKSYIHSRPANIPLSFRRRQLHLSSSMSSTIVAHRSTHPSTSRLYYRDTTSIAHSAVAKHPNPHRRQIPRHSHPLHIITAPAMLLSRCVILLCVGYLDEELVWELVIIVVDAIAWNEEMMWRDGWMLLMLCVAYPGRLC